MSVRWGIIGTGEHADEILAPAITAEGSPLVGVVSRDPKRAQDFAQRHGAAHPYTKYEDLLQNPDVDVVLITTPNALHADEVVAAAKAGKHVLCDKPLATTSADAARAVDACRRAKVKLGIDFQIRQTASSVETRRLIESGAIGDVLVIQAEHSAGRKPHWNWRTNRELAGYGATHNIAVHTYDQIRYWVGSEVVEVMAMFDTGQSTELDTLVMSLFRFENGALAYVNANQTIANRQNDYVVYGTAGRIVGRHLTRDLQDGELRVISGDAPETSTAYSTHDAFQRVVADMNRAIAEDREPFANGLDGLRCVQLVEAVALSAKEGRLVRPNYAVGSD